MPLSILRTSFSRLLDRLTAPLAWSVRRFWLAALLARRLPLAVRGRVHFRVGSAPLGRPGAVVEEDGLRMDLDLDDDVQRGIFFRTYERAELDALLERVRPGDVCLDVGANVGLYACRLGRRVGASGAVHAFEPDPANLGRLRTNISLSGLEDVVRVHPVAVSSSRGSASFHRSAATHSGWGALRRYPDFHEEVIEVPTVTLDRFLEERGLTEVALLKVDVEGADFQVYGGAEESLRRRRFRWILAEWNGVWLPDEGWTVKRFLNYFRDYGYEPVWGPGAGWKRLAGDPQEGRGRVFNVLFERSP